MEEYDEHSNKILEQCIEKYKPIWDKRNKETNYREKHL